MKILGQHFFRGYGKSLNNILSVGDPLYEAMEKEHELFRKMMNSISDIVKYTDKGDFEFVRQNIENVKANFIKTLADQFNISSLQVSEKLDSFSFRYSLAPLIYRELRNDKKFLSVLSRLLVNRYHEDFDFLELIDFGYDLVDYRKKYGKTGLFD